jgi:D-alanyl-D-alanine carboxypeptidase
MRTITWASVVLLTLIAPPGMAQTPASTQRVSESEAINALQVEAARATAADEFSGVLLVARQGKVVFQHAYGEADREQHIANTLDTKFRFGSMGKMFTGVATLQLVQAGKLKLTDTVGKILPDYPNQEVAQVTIEQLLTHTGGTGDFFGPEFLARRNEMKAHADYVSLLGARGVNFTPGSRHEYSNYGYILLGRIIEVVSGQRYYDYVAQHVFKPAGMNSTGYTPEQQAEPLRVIAYTKRAQPMLIQRAPQDDAAGPLPPLQRDAGMDAGTTVAWHSAANDLDYRGTSAGGGFSTVANLLKFATALMSNQLLNDEFTQLAITGKVDTGRPGLKYAYGFEDASVDGIRRIGHGGGATGQNAWLGIYPATGYVVIGMANFDPPAAESLTRFVTAHLPLLAQQAAQ